MMKKKIDPSTNNRTYITEPAYRSELHIKMSPTAGDQPYKSTLPVLVLDVVRTLPWYDCPSCNVCSYSLSFRRSSFWLNQT